MKNLLPFIVLLAAGFAGKVHAHDFWIEPSTFRPAAGRTFTAALRVGDDFAGHAVPRRSARIESFVVRDANGERAVNGIENRDPAGFVQLAEAGTAVIGYRGKQSQHELSAAKFRAFLKEEGIEWRTGDPACPGRQHCLPSTGIQRERYFRFAKSIVGPGAAPIAEKPFGWRFELVPAGDRFRLLFEGKPLRDALVTAISRTHARMSARTDANGLVSFDLKQGVWLIKSTHVLAAPRESGFDWESLWASLTLER